jgi:hypothetical protein
MQHAPRASGAAFSSSATERNAVIWLDVRNCRRYSGNPTFLRRALSRGSPRTRANSG